MNIEGNNNNINKQPITSGKEIEKKSEMKTDEMLRFAIKMCAEKIAESSERCVPEYNKFSPHNIAFYIPGTSNIANITVKQDEEDYKTQRRVLIGVHHKNSDAVMSNYIFKGTKKEVLEYLKTIPNENLEEIMDLIKNLSKESDDYHSSL